MNQKRRIQAGSIALYALAVLLLCYGAYMAFTAYTYVADYYGYQGTDITANLGEAFQYVISQSSLYICFSIVFYVMGLLLQKLNDLHDFLPREYLRPKEVEEQDVEIAEDAVGQKVWETPLAAEEPIAVCVRSGALFKIGVQRRKDALTGPSVSIRVGGIAHGGIGSRIV